MIFLPFIFYKKKKSFDYKMHYYDHEMMHYKMYFTFEWRSYNFVLVFL